MKTETKKSLAIFFVIIIPLFISVYLLTSLGIYLDSLDNGWYRFGATVIVSTVVIISAFKTDNFISKIK